MDFLPFGETLWQSSGSEPRKGFIDKEKDQESALHNFGARAYDDEIGQFPTPDVLWEKFPQWSPYVYSYCNPLRYSDPNGQAGGPTLPFPGIAPTPVVGSQSASIAIVEKIRQADQWFYNNYRHDAIEYVKNLLTNLSRRYKR